MKKYVYFVLFFLIFVFNNNVFATTTNVTSKIRYDTDNPGGTYKGDEIYNGGYNGKFSVNTRYNGRLSLIEFYLSDNDYSLTASHTYTITLNMATNDWRNNFMGPQVIKANCDGTLQSTHLTVSNFQFVSRKQIKFNFKTGSTLPCNLFFRLYSTDYASNNTVAITGDTNWNLSSITINDNISSSSGGSSGSGSSGSGSSGSTDATNQQIIDNQNQNAQNIIDSQNQSTTDIIENNNDNTQQIIDNQNQNNQNLIDNQNQNTQEIIDNQNQNNQNTQDTLNQNLSNCYITSSNRNIAGTSDYWEKGDISTSLGGVPSPTGLTENISYIRTKYFIKVNPNTTYYFGYLDTSAYSIYFYKSDFSFKKRYGNNQQTEPITFTTDSDVYYIKIAMRNSTGSWLISPNYVTTNKVILTLNSSSHNYIAPVVSYVCKSKIDSVNDTITNDNIDSNLGSDFFNNFNNNMHGLSSIITIPLNSINSLSSSACSPISFPIPFTNKNLTLPCMTEIYQQHVPTLLTLVQTCWFGILSYYVLVDIFKTVKGFKDPDSDKIEVLDL